jgi:hypothetical protein
MSDHDLFMKEVSRRTAMKTALKASAYAAPVILSATIAEGGVAAATLPPISGTLTGTILNAITSAPIVGATVAVGARATTTNSFGVYTLPSVPAGAQTLTTSAPGFTIRTDPVTVPANASKTFSPALVPLSAANDITIVLTWGLYPQDLDAHLSGPDVVHGGRFEVAFFDMNPVPYASLTTDVTFGYGPETDSVTTYTGGAFVPGDYHFWAENYNMEVGYDASDALATVYHGGSQIAQFAALDATGVQTAVVWYAFGFTLTATGQITITPAQQFTDTPPVAPRSVPKKKK